MFTGFVAVRPACNTCGLGLRVFDTRDGPAALLIVALALAGLALTWWLEGWPAPPRWIHLVVWPGAILAAAILIRPLKASLIARQYRARTGSLR